MDAASLVIPGEDPAAYDALAADYHRHFQPQSPVEHFHVDTLIRSDWQKRRHQRVKAKLYRTLLDEGSIPEDLDIAILRDSPTAGLLQKVTARIASFERAPSMTSAASNASAARKRTPVGRPDRPLPVRANRLRSVTLSSTASHTKSWKIRTSSRPRN